MGRAVVATLLVALVVATLLFTLVVAAAQSPAAAGDAVRPALNGALVPPRSPRNASYSIDAGLDPRERRITATEVITWRNISGRPAPDLQFHLYWNAWRDVRSTWMRERALAAPIRASEDEFASIDVKTLKVRRSPDGPGADLTPLMRFIAPDDGNEHDRTVMIVDLPEPVAPGETITIDLSWDARVPRTFARTGAIGDFFFVAQWFPKLGVLQDDGWNCHQFHASTEFFSDFGVYDVRLTVPRGWTVGATGVERGRRDEGERTTHHYYQEDVHDFAWTASPDYIERRARFEHQTLPPVEMRLLLQPEHEHQAERHFDATRAALRLFGEWFGGYPYGHITIVDPAFQSGADGMEYPTLLTAGTRWLVPDEVVYSTPEEVTIHEVGHQWWYGVVATNEFEHAWLDEGSTTYASARALTSAYGQTYLEERYFGGFVPWVFTEIPLRRETYGNRLAGYRPAAESDVPADPSFRYHPISGPYITYNKTALWLNTLERWLGWDAVQRSLSRFFERYQFTHPGPPEFLNTIAETTGRRLDPFVDEVYESSNAFDYGIESLQTMTDDGGYRTTVLVRRYGEAIFPVDVRVTFADGEQVTERWSGEERWKLYSYDKESRARSAVVDPERVLLLDVNYTNNSRTLEPKGRDAAMKWSLRWLVWLQDALLTWGFFV
jgi:hypothetical protein